MALDYSLRNPLNKNKVNRIKASNRTKDVFTKKNDSFYIAFEADQTRFIHPLLSLTFQCVQSTSENLIRKNVITRPLDATDYALQLELFVNCGSLSVTTYMTIHCL